MLRSVIIDDEPQNASILKNDIIAHCPSVEVIAVCHSAKEGIMAISQFLRTDDGYVVLKNGEKLSVSRAKKDMLMARLVLK